MPPRSRDHSVEAPRPRSTSVASPQHHAAVRQVVLTKPTAVTTATKKRARSTTAESTPTVFNKSIPRRSSNHSNMTSTPPRTLPNRSNASSPTLSSHSPATTEKLRQVLDRVREISVLGRLAYVEFESLPEPSVHPTYYELISHPVSLKCLQKGLRPNGEYHTPALFAKGFLQMCLNAKKFNRSNSTIYKDANRLYACFKSEMIRLFPQLHVEDCDSDDEDEAEAWGRDLRQRSTLAFYERDQFREAQAVFLKLKAAGENPKLLARRRERLRFADEPLVFRKCHTFPAGTVVGECISRAVFAEISGKLEPVSAKSHDEDGCGICSCDPIVVDEAHPSAEVPLFAGVVTPSYRPIRPPRGSEEEAEEEETSTKEDGDSGEEDTDSDEVEEEDARILAPSSKPLMRRLTGPKRHHQAHASPKSANKRVQLTASDRRR